VLLVCAEVAIRGDEKEIPLNGLPDNQTVKGVLVASPWQPVETSRLLWLQFDRLKIRLFCCSGQVLRIQAFHFYFPQSILQGDLPEAHHAHRLSTAQGV